MSQNNLVYSTGIGRLEPQVKEQPKSKNTDGIVRIRRETKGRKGKGVTTIDGVDLPAEALKNLCSELKKSCGTGGAIKNGVIEIQGDNRDKIKLLLEKKGLTVKLAGG
ncbi:MULTISPECIES: stress response translation initiation inhibitor YciH [Alteromonadaceae]|uniref:stress response translation initiation inhibitor YciH n=1 Tax=Alteromonadaceae TaxID=72275 RepID=UPI001C0A38CD|nr:MULTISPECIES: stress response translation initiation inhibitor YciH [Aliiglaciecola]MBU2878076.1 stress response translation initiation inhibitor YciH [Aliiglaciecola lipolytica]MDO6709441.1 stress response translation initiation inhibitor YciH [Aliiglaciecola sp. 2_MG-2023]MDO6750589.1 stress response translation initiation inhibitor YciH [Aliiglaciecola sp. 1_MG-2023]